jgi:hypothetical protein
VRDCRDRPDGDPFRHELLDQAMNFQREMRAMLAKVKRR